MKKINLQTSVYDLIKQDPEIQNIMVELGFSDLKNPAMLNTVGRYMTLAKGSRLKKIPMEKIIAAFLAAGFEIEGADHE